MTGTRKIPMPEDLKAENKMWVGLKVRKYFGKHGWHVGQVQSVWKQGAKFFYRIVYEDQDKEDMDQKAVRRFCISRIPKLKKATSSSSADSALTNALRKYQHKAVEKLVSGRVIAGVVKNARYASGNRIVFELNFKNKKTEEVGLRELTKLLVEEPQPKETPDAAHAKPEDEETDDVISDTDDDADDRMDTGDSAATPARTPSAVQQVATADASNRKSPATEGTSTPIEA